MERWVTNRSSSTKLPSIQQEVEPLAGGELALLVLLGDPIGPPALLGERLPMAELVEPLLR